jgi:hypothetical protein
MAANTPSRLSIRTAPACPIFGNGEELTIPNRVLPTFVSVMKGFIHERTRIKSVNNKDPSVQELSKTIAEKIHSIYLQASIPTVSMNRIVRKIQDYHGKYRTISKYPENKKQSQSYLNKVKQFKCDAQKLFDIGACKCITFQTCSCSKENKVPKLEQAFLIDQRTVRKMAIGSVDFASSKKIQVSQIRRRKRELFLDKQMPSTSRELQSFQIESVSSSESEAVDSSSESEAVVSSSESEVFKEPDSIKRKRSSEKKESQLSCKKLCLSSLAKVCDRTGVSDRAAAIIASTVLHDVKGATEPDPSLIIDRSKIRRARKQSRDKIQEGVNTGKSIVSIYFDGRKDRTTVQEQKDSKYYRKTVVEEHITLVAEPDQVYLGHFATDSGTAKNICKGICEFLESNNIDDENLVAVGCDGTAVNTGANGGVIRLMEVHLSRPLQWLVCQLHANELPLRHLIEKLDGKTSGPRGFVGPIGKQLQKCETLPIANFQPIKVDIPFVDINDLSTDQKYLIDIHQAVSSGECNPDLSRRNPGKMAHSRWLTTANRILRLYVATEEPSEELQDIVSYVMNVYAPVWFAIKRSKSIVDGAHNLFKTIQYSQPLNDNVKRIIQPVIQRNAFFGHPENILLTMIQDDRSQIRELGWRRIKKARAEYRGKTIRDFKIPPLNFESTDYTNLINWQDIKVTEPPLTRKFVSDDDMEDSIANRTVKDIHKLPCHTQAVERLIKLVTEASSAVVGAKSRDGFIRNRLSSRQVMPTFETKSEFRL